MPSTPEPQFDRCSTDGYVEAHLEVEQRRRRIGLNEDSDFTPTISNGLVAYALVATMRKPTWWPKDRDDDGL